MELKVFTEDGISRVISGVTDQTTCRDVMVAVAQATGSQGTYSMLLLWGNIAKTLLPNDKPMDIVKNFAESSTNTRFLIKLNNSRSSNNNNLKVSVANKLKQVTDNKKTAVLNIDKPIRQKQHRLKKAHTFNAPFSTKTNFFSKYEDSQHQKMMCDNLKNIDQSNAKPLNEPDINNTAETIGPSNRDNFSELYSKIDKKKSAPVPKPRTTVTRNLPIPMNIPPQGPASEETNFQLLSTDGKKNLKKSDLFAFKPLPLKNNLSNKNLPVSKNLAMLQENNIEHSGSSKYKKSKCSNTDALKKKLNDKMLDLQQQQQEIQLLNKGSNLIFVLKFNRIHFQLKIIVHFSLEIVDITEASNDVHGDNREIEKEQALEQKLDADIQRLDRDGWKEKLEEESEKVRVLKEHDDEINSSLLMISNEILKTNLAIEALHKEIKSEEELCEVIQQETMVKMKQDGDGQIEELKSELERMTNDLSRHNKLINEQLVEISQKQSQINS
ncbi:hypothetical protein HELRODRAFT_163049 [Helobdella robusta]|uniref:Ras-associating domain-containing protein n=1 Tax=Helobdella robusta TaxID=6412 RepID=T1ETL7_HELRO|nr:hypothetical protein HELRODRAFT_163049 [Helobdella robusta]ESN96023.1 hypothetical protein HELRODRAFT_163049 [Helobdella robusta]